MNSNKSDEILSEIRDLLKEQIDLISRGVEEIKIDKERSENTRKKSMELQEIAINRSKSNWRLYRIIVTIVLIMFAYLIYKVSMVF